MALVPHLRSVFDLPYGLAMLAESAFFLAYFVFSAPTSKLIETIGYKKTMVGFVVHSSDWRADVHSGGQADEFSAVPDGIVCDRGRRDGAADFGEPVCVDPGAGSEPRRCG